MTARKPKQMTLSKHLRSCRKCREYYCHEAQAIIYLTSPVFAKSRAAAAARSLKP